MLCAPTLKISRHAIQQYRARVIGCPERHRSDSMLKAAIERQVRYGTWQCVGGETFEIVGGAEMPKRNRPWETKVVSITYRFVIECQTVVTVLGFMMRTDHRRIQRRRRRQRVARLNQQLKQEG